MQQAYHIFPEAMMHQLPGYRSDDAPAVALSQEQIQVLEQAEKAAFIHWRDKGLTTVTFTQLAQLVEESLQQASIGQADRQTILAYAINWFEAHPQRWGITINPQSGQPWLEALQLP